MKLSGKTLSKNWSNVVCEVAAALVAASAPLVAAAGDMAEILADPDKVPEQQAECQSHRRDDLEVDHGDQPDLAYPFDVSGRNDTDGDCEKDQRRDRRLDQPQEDVTEDLQGGAEFGPYKTNDDSENHADRNLQTEVLP
jgi:hypothetical protein